MLIAYYTGSAINIADVDFQSGGADTGTMAHIAASDMVSITGLSGLTPQVALSLIHPENILV